VPAIATNQQALPTTGVPYFAPDNKKPLPAHATRNGRGYQSCIEDILASIYWRKRASSLCFSVRFIVALFAWNVKDPSPIETQTHACQFLLSKLQSAVQTNGSVLDSPLLHDPLLPSHTVRQQELTPTL